MVGFYPPLAVTVVLFFLLPHVPHGGIPDFQEFEARLALLASISGFGLLVTAHRTAVKFKDKKDEWGRYARAVFSEFIGASGAVIMGLPGNVPAEALPWGVVAFLALFGRIFLLPLAEERPK